MSVTTSIIGSLEDLHPHLRVDLMLVREVHLYLNTVYTVLLDNSVILRGECRAGFVILFVWHQWYCPMGCTNFFNSTRLTFLTWLVPNTSHTCPHFCMSVLKAIIKCSNCKGKGRTVLARTSITTKTKNSIDIISQISGSTLSA